MSSRRFVLFLLLVSMAFISSAQETVVANKKWEGFYNSNPNNTFQAKFRSFTKEIDGKNYLELMYKVEEGWFEGVRKYYRQEGYKVYKKLENEEEYLILDFGLSVGDTVRLSDEFGDQFDFFPIRRTDTIILQQTLRKLEMRVRPVNGTVSNVPHVWIEGVGDIGFFFGNEYIFGNQNASPIFCVREDGEYFSNLIMCPDILSSTVSFKEEEDFLYNPVLKSLSIKNSDFEWVYIYTIAGVKLHSVPLEEHSRTIDLNNIPVNLCVIVLRRNNFYTSTIIRL